MSMFITALALTAALHMSAGVTTSVETAADAPEVTTQLHTESDPALVPSAIRDAYSPGSRLYTDALQRASIP